MQERAGLVDARWLAWAVAILPFVTVHLCYLVSASQGYVDWCVPYWDGCTSISRAGRHGTSYFLFKAGMMPTAVLMMLFWFLQARWLQRCAPSDQPPPRIDTLPVFGMLAGVFLMLYTLTLGHHGDSFHVMRRIGVVCYFVFTFICQVQTNGRLLRSEAPPWVRFGKGLNRISLVTLLIGVLSLVLDVTLGERYDDMEDGFEWVLALMINVHLFGLAWLWQRQKVTLRFV